MKKHISSKENNLVEWILRLGVFGTFLGHGIFALMVKESWIKYFLAVGITEQGALMLMPLIGIMDVLVAISVLIKPMKPVLWWAVIWAFATALIRPISGEPILDFVERAANFMTPLALLAFYGFLNKFKKE